MTDKLIIKSMADPSADVIDNRVEISIDSDGQLHKLTRVKQLTLYLDADDSPEAVFTVYTKGLATEVVIDRNTAQAVLRSCAERELSFISDTEAASLRRLLEIFGGIYAGVAMTGEHTAGFDVLTKIIVELARREGV